MKKTLKTLLVVMMVALLVVACVACEETPAETKITVTFKNGSEVVKTVELKDGESLKASDLPNDPTSEGKEFAGWFNGEVKLEIGKTQITADVTFTAKFTDAEQPTDTHVVTAEQWTSLLNALPNATNFTVAAGVNVVKFDGDKILNQSEYGDSYLSKEGNDYFMYSKASASSNWSKERTTKTFFELVDSNAKGMISSIDLALKDKFSSFTYADGKYTVASLNLGEQTGEIKNVELAFNNGAFVSAKFTVTQGDSDVTYTFSDVGSTSVALPSDFIDNTTPVLKAGTWYMVEQTKEGWAVTDDFAIVISENDTCTVAGEECKYNVDKDGVITVTGEIIAEISEVDTLYATIDGKLMWVFFSKDDVADKHNAVQNCYNGLDIDKEDYAKIVEIFGDGVLNDDKPEPVTIDEAYLGEWEGYISSYKYSFVITEHEIVLSIDEDNFVITEISALERGGYEFSFAWNAEYVVHCELYIIDDVLCYYDDDEEEEIELSAPQGAPEFPEELYGKWYFVYYGSKFENIYSAVIITSESITIDGNSCSLSDVEWSEDWNHRNLWKFTIDGVEYTINEYYGEISSDKFSGDKELKKASENVTITFKAGTESSAEVLKEVEIPFGSSLSEADYPANPEKPGYTFVKWQADTDYPYVDVTSELKFLINAKLYPVWEQTAYIVTFKCEGADDIQKSVEKAQSGSTTLSASDIPAAPEKDGYDFLGWFTSGGSKAAEGLAVYGDATFTAKFVKLEDYLGVWRTATSGMGAKVFVNIEKEGESVKLYGLGLNGVALTYGNGMLSLTESGANYSFELRDASLVLIITEGDDNSTRYEFTSETCNYAGTYVNGEQSFVIGNGGVVVEVNGVKVTAFWSVIYGAFDSSTFSTVWKYETKQSADSDLETVVVSFDNGNLVLNDTTYVKQVEQAD